MSGFNTKERNDNGEYEITFYTENHEDFKKVQDLCRELIDHNKPVSTEGDMLPVGTTFNIKPEDIKWNGGDQISKETIEKIIVGMLEKWADGYSYIEIPTDDAIKEMKSAIDNAEPVTVNCKDCDGYEAGYSAGLKDAEKSQVECENCDFRKFSDSFIDGIVDVMNKNCITSVEQLSELLKGDKE